MRLIQMLVLLVWLFVCGAIMWHGVYREHFAAHDAGPKQVWVGLGMGILTALALGKAAYDSFEDEE